MPSGIRRAVSYRALQVGNRSSGGRSQERVALRSPWASSSPGCRARARRPVGGSRGAEHVLGRQHTPPREIIHHPRRHWGPLLTLAAPVPSVASLRAGPAHDVCRAGARASKELAFGEDREEQRVCWAASTRRPSPRITNRTSQAPHFFPVGTRTNSGVVTADGSTDEPKQMRASRGGRSD